MSENSKKYGHIIFTDPGYSLLTIGTLFLGIVVVWMFNSLLLIPAISRVNTNIREYTLLLSTINNMIMFVLIPFLYLKRRYIDYRIFTGINGRLSHSHIFTFAALALGAFLLTQGLQFYWFKLLDMLGLEYSLPSTPISGLDGLVTSILFIVAAPALSEEFLFRGVIMRSIAGVYGGRRAVLLSAALFCLMHMNIASIPTTFVVGLVTGFAVYRSRCLQGGVIMHFVHNLIVVVINFLGMSAGAGTAAEQSQAPVMVYAALGIMIMAVTLFLINRRGPLPGTLPNTKAAIPHRLQRDMLPFALAAAIMLARMI